MVNLAGVTGKTRIALLQAVDELGFQALGVGDSDAIDFVELSHRDDWPLMYRASADLVDAKGAGHLHAVVGEASDDYPPKVEQLRLTGASCAESTSADGEILITCSWVSPDPNAGVVSNRVIRIFSSGVFIDVGSSNQDSQSSIRSRAEPPFDMNTLQKIVNQQDD